MEQNFEKHYGELVEIAVRKAGYNLTDLARNLGVNRRTVYNWFNNKKLHYSIIFRIGILLKINFSNMFPELFSKEDFVKMHEPKKPDNIAELNDDQIVFKVKYERLLKQFNAHLEDSSTNDLSCLNILD